MIREIAPAPDALADQESEGRNIKHRQEPYLAQLADDRTDQQRTDQAAVDCKAAVADIEDRFPVSGVAVPVENHVVQSCADDTADHAADDAVQRTVGIQTEAAHSAERVDHCKHHAGRDEKPVPCDGKAENGKGNTLDGHLQSELRKADEIPVIRMDQRTEHNSDSSFPSDSGSMTERQI